MSNNNDNNDNYCPICHEPLCSSNSKIGVVNPCGHVFHEACFEGWVKINRERQWASSSSISSSSRGLVVKCPSCNCESSSQNRFINMYLNLESFVRYDDNIDDDEDDGEDESDIDIYIDIDSKSDEKENDEEGDGDDELGDGNEVQPNANESSSTSTVTAKVTPMTSSNPPSSSSPSPSLQVPNGSSSTADDIKRLKLEKKSQKQQIKYLKERIQSYIDFDSEHTKIKDDLARHKQDLEDIMKVRETDIITQHKLQREVKEKNNKITDLQNQLNLTDIRNASLVFDIVDLKEQHKRQLEDSNGKKMHEIQQLLQNAKEATRQRDDYLELCQIKEKKNRDLEKKNRDLERQIDRRKNLPERDVESEIATMKQNNTMRMNNRTKSMKRIVEETKEEFDSKKREERRVEELKEAEQNHKEMMRRTSSQARKMHRASKSSLSTSGSISKSVRPKSTASSQKVSQSPMMKLSVLKKGLSGKRRAGSDNSLGSVMKVAQPAVAGTNPSSSSSSNTTTTTRSDGHISRRVNAVSVRDTHSYQRRSVWPGSVARSRITQKRPGANYDIRAAFKRQNSST